MSKINTFKDIIFEEHPNVPGAIRGNCELPNDWSLTVTAGPGFYSNPGGIAFKDDIKSPKEVYQFEVAVINEAGKYTSKTKGWQTREDIDEIIKEVSDTVNRHINKLL